MKYRHKKTGNTYEVIGVAPLVCSANTVVSEGEDLCIYLDEGRVSATTKVPKVGSTILGLAEVQAKRDLRLGDHVYVYHEEGDSELLARPAREFEDGRYERAA